ncbi:hypothetical protein E9536_40925 [Burkholderia sp. LS-044]|nr:hypothetical protein E9536_40925 [Burkholderia sp. LS-044]
MKEPHPPQITSAKVTSATVNELLVTVEARKAVAGGSDVHSLEYSIHGEAGPWNTISIIESDRTTPGSVSGKQTVAPHPVSGEVDMSMGILVRATSYCGTHSQSVLAELDSGLFEFVCKELNDIQVNREASVSLVVVPRGRWIFPPATLKIEWPEGLTDPGNPANTYQITSAEPHHGANVIFTRQELIGKPIGTVKAELTGTLFGRTANPINLKELSADHGVYEFPRPWFVFTNLKDDILYAAASNIRLIGNFITRKIDGTKSESKTLEGNFVKFEYRIKGESKFISLDNTALEYAPGDSSFVITLPPEPFSKEAIYEVELRAFYDETDAQKKLGVTDAHGFVKIDINNQSPHMSAPVAFVNPANVLMVRASVQSPASDPITQAEINWDGDARETLTIGGASGNWTLQSSNGINVKNVAHALKPTLSVSTKHGHSDTADPQFNDLTQLISLNVVINSAAVPISLPGMKALDLDTVGIVSPADVIGDALSVVVDFTPLVCLSLLNLEVHLTGIELSGEPTVSPAEQLSEAETKWLSRWTGAPGNSLLLSLKEKPARKWSVTLPLKMVSDHPHPEFSVTLTDAVTSHFTFKKKNARYTFKVNKKKSA